MFNLNCDDMKRIYLMTALSHLRSKRFAESSVRTVLLTVILMLPFCLHAIDGYRSYDPNVVYLEKDGLCYVVQIDRNNRTAEAAIYGYSTSEPITYDEWNTDSTLTIEPFHLEYGDLDGYDEYDIDQEAKDLLYYLWEIPVTAIRKEAFYQCTDLKNVKISSGVKSIGRRAFRKSSIKSLQIEYSSDNRDVEIGEECFRECRRLETLQIGRSVEEIPAGMCLSCPALDFVVISPAPNNTLKKIGALAFANCTSLTYLDANNAVDAIGKGAFVNCYALKNIWMPRAQNTAKSIGDYAFGNCYSLVYYDFNNVLQSIGNGAFFNCDGLTYLTIPGSVTAIGDYAFTGCDNLTDLKLHDALTTIGQRAFSACYQLKGVEIPNSVTSIGEAAFSGARASYALWGESALTDTTFLEIASSFESYGVDQGGMKRIVIGNSLDTIANYTFGGQVPDTIVCMAPVPPVWMGTYVFSRNAYSGSVLCVPRVLVESYAAAPGWENFQHIEGIEVFGDGDLTGNGILDVTDVTLLIGMALNSEDVSAKADLNGDGQITVSDITILINMLLNAAN